MKKKSWMMWAIYYKDSPMNDGVTRRLFIYTNKYAVVSQTSSKNIRKIKVTEM